MRRRTFIKSAGVLATTIGITGSASASESGFTSVGVNKFDADSNGEINIFFRPTRGRIGGRAGVRNLTSDGESAGDYLTSVRSIPNTSMSEFTGNDPTTLTYDYYDTPENDAATPDEVWVRVEDEGESRTFYRASNDNNEDGAVGEWVTREIHKEFVGNPNFNAGYNWFEIDDGDASRVSESLVETVGEDATLTRVGIGGSRFGGDVVTDFYVDKLYLDGHPIGNLPSEGN